MPSNQYETLLEHVYKTGVDKNDRTGVGTRSVFGYQMRFNLAEGFPLVTTKKLHIRSIVHELLWFLSGSSNIKYLHDNGVSIWDEWADETGSIGKAYGYQIGQKSHYAEGDFDQMDRVLYDLKHNPASRRIMTNMYNHKDLHEMGLAPCAYSMTFNVTGDTLNAILNQRSQDMLTANNWNVCQYAALLIMFAKASGLKAGELVHVIADAHIYDRHIDAVKRIIEKEPYPAPEMVVEDITDFYKFTKNSFTLKDYKYHDFNEKIEVAI